MEKIVNVENIEKNVEAVTAVNSTTLTPGFGSAAGFELIQRIAKMFCNSTLVPEQFRGEKNFGNCVIALNMAQRLNADALMVLQNLYVVYGNPSWSSKFLIALFNQCGRYTSIKYRETGKKGTDSQGVIAYTTEKLTGEVIEGPEVTISIAKAEGWTNKKGSKWLTMPDQMLRYRAAAWLIRTTAPELSMGLQTREEIIDVTPIPVDEAKKEIAENANTEEFVPQIDAAKDMPVPNVDVVVEQPQEKEPAKKAEKEDKAEKVEKAVKEPAAKGPGF